MRFRLRVALTALVAIVCANAAMAASAGAYAGHNTRFDIADGNTRTLDFEEIGGGSISGTLRESFSGGVLADEWIWFDVFDTGGNAHAHVSGLTDALGRYTIAGLPPGTYYLEAVSEGPYTVTRQLYPAIACDPGACANPTTGQPLVSSSGIEVTGIDFTFTPFAVVSGHVKDAATGVPLAGIAVAGSICPNPNSHCSTIQHEAYTNGAGNYSLFLFDVPQQFIVTANGSPYIDRAYPNVPCVTGESCTAMGTPLTPTAGMHATHIDFSLDLGARFSGATMIQLADVKIFDSEGRYVRTVSTDWGGHYETPSWFAGTYYALLENFLDDPCMWYRDLFCEWDYASTIAHATPIVLGAGEFRTDIDFDAASIDKIFRNGFR